MNSKGVYQGKRETALTVLSLFASAGTLLCCALPALLVTLGMGAVIAGLVTNFPQLIWISEHKKPLFLAAFLLLLAAGWMLWRARLMACPIDPRQAEACKKLRKMSVYIYGLSVVVYVIGFFFAFIAARLL